MIKKMQIKFIIITMCAAIIVVGGIFGVITAENYVTTNNQIDILMNLIAENNGVMPEYKDRVDNLYQFITRETKYSTRYFTILVNSENKIISADMKNIARATSNDIDMIFDAVQNMNKTEGFYDNYKYKIVQKDENRLLIFLDCTVQLNNLKNSTYKSIMIIVFALITVFLMAIALSKRVLKPIVENVENQKHFITNASHELKTPLAVINSDIDVLELSVGEDNEWIISMRNQVNRLNTLIKSLLNLANIEENRREVHFEQFSLTEIVSETLQEFKALLQNKNVKFDDTKDITIIAEVNSIKQLIILLLDNCIKYTPDNGIIEIKIEKLGKNTKIEISNTCVDAKNININKLFDRFYRDDKSRNKKKEGYGIGLSIAKSIVDLHKGKISAGIDKKDRIYFRIVI